MPMMCESKPMAGASEGARTLGALAEQARLDWAVAGSRSAATMPIRSVSDDSREACAGALHVVRPGAGGSSGLEHMAQALAVGASALAMSRSAWSEGSRGQLGVPVLLFDDPTEAVGRIADAFWGRPAAALRMVGVTGTNGKTTVAMLVRQFAAVAGVRCGLLGTVVTDEGCGPTASKLTTPGRMALTASLGRMVANGCTAASMEVSSHALAQGRVHGIVFGTAIFTNLTGDHLDFHGTMEAYADAKAALFEGLAEGATAIVNIDDPWAPRMLRSCRARIVRCSLRDRDAEAFCEIHGAGLRGMDLSLHGPWGVLDVRVPLFGDHNAMNVLQAVAGAWALGVGARILESALQGCQAPPGRLEPASGSADDIAVLVDYAHTDDALENVLRACRGCVAPGGSLTAVFGCGGDRDRTKRPRMAAVACRLADRTWVTSDNPRTEVPESIVAEVMAGVPAEANSRVVAVVDRALAISRAIAEARPGDLVVIAGKGHENYQIVGTERRHFDDREEARKALAVRRGARP